jgi:hypothetical protein
MKRIKRSMKTPHKLVFMLVYIIASAAAAEELGRWDWVDRGEAETAFCDKYMPPALELRKTQGNEAAIEALEEAYQLAEKEFENPRFFYQAIWFEAQVKGGKDDEEWGLAVFEYLYDREMTKNTNWGCSCIMHINHYPLCGNLIAKSFHLGRTANARKYALKVEDSLRQDRHFDLTGESYADQGPVFGFLDDARKRDFPIYMHETAVENPALKKDDFIPYLCIYAMIDVADIAHISGDWVKAAELYYWGIQYADEYMAKAPVTNMRGEVGKNTGYYTHRNLAALAMLHGYPSEAAEYLSAYIEKGTGYYKAWDCLVLDAKLELAVTQIMTGELEESALEIADQAVISISEELHNSRAMLLHAMLNKARVYHALGYQAEAWALLDDLLERTAVDVNPHHWVQVLDTTIDLALADGGTRPELEEWLVLALDSARLTGNKHKELPLYEKYARFLSMHGRLSEALLIQQEAVRLSKAINLPKRLNSNMDRLTGIKNRLEDENNNLSSGEPETAPSPANESVVESEDNPEELPPSTAPEAARGSAGIITPAVDIQPRLSYAAALHGQAAYGRFYIYNPSSDFRTGTLQFNGPVDQVQWLNEQWLTISSSPEFEAVQLERKIILEAGAFCIVDITGLPAEDGTGAEIECQWSPEGVPESTASGIWKYQTAATAKRTAVIDAHELQSNPFYLIPIHHMIQRTSPEQRQVVDFAVEASSPMRIESYDAETGKLLSVDATGDGDFSGEGDQVVGDNNHNNWPDLAFEKNQKLSSLVMYVQPLDSATADTELTIRIKANGEWQTDATDVIKPYTGSGQ